MYKWEYKTPEGYDDLIMNSDGTYLTCLRFTYFQRNSQMVRYIL